MLFHLHRSGICIPQDTNWSVSQDSNLPAKLPRPSATPVRTLIYLVGTHSLQGRYRMGCTIPQLSPVVPMLALYLGFEPSTDRLTAEPPRLEEPQSILSFFTYTFMFFSMAISTQQTTLHHFYFNLRPTKRTSHIEVFLRWIFVVEL